MKWMNKWKNDGINELTESWLNELIIEGMMEWMHKWRNDGMHL